MAENGFSFVFNENGIQFTENGYSILGSKMAANKMKKKKKPKSLSNKSELYYMY